MKKLNFKIASYDLDGHFRGFEDLTDQLILCNNPEEEIERVYEIGTTTEIQCTFDLWNLVSGNKNMMPRKANRFFELFLEDYNGNMVDVPVLIANIKRNGEIPNRPVEREEH